MVAFAPGAGDVAEGEFEVGYLVDALLVELPALGELLGREPAVPIGRPAARAVLIIGAGSDLRQPLVEGVLEPLLDDGVEGLDERGERPQRGGVDAGGAEGIVELAAHVGRRPPRTASEPAPLPDRFFDRLALSK